MAGYCPNSFCMEQDAIVVHSHTQTKTLTIILQRVIISIYYMADTTFFLQDAKGNPKGKVYAQNDTLLKPSCYLLFSRLVFLALVPNIGYNVTMLQWLNLVFGRLPFQEGKRTLS